jgi:hypothetical protein
MCFLGLGIFWLLGLFHFLLGDTVQGAALAADRGRMEQDIVLLQRELQTTAEDAQRAKDAVKIKVSRAPANLGKPCRDAFMPCI